LSTLLKNILENILKWKLVTKNFLIQFNIAKILLINGNLNLKV